MTHVFVAVDPVCEPSRQMCANASFDDSHLAVVVICLMSNSFCVDVVTSNVCNTEVRLKHFRCNGRWQGSDSRYNKPLSMHALTCADVHMDVVSAVCLAVAQDMTRAHCRTHMPDISRMFFCCSTAIGPGADELWAREVLCAEQQHGRCRCRLLVGKHSRCGAAAMPLHR